MKGEGLLRAFLVPATLAAAWQAWSNVASTFLFVSATLEQCHLDCTGDPPRLVGPTEPAPELEATYPFAVAPFPLPFHRFCQLGCSFFFAGSPRTTTCGELCDDFYHRDVSVGINDYAEKVASISIDMPNME